MAFQKLRFRDFEHFSTYVARFYHEEADSIIETKREQFDEAKRLGYEPFFAAAAVEAYFPVSWFIDFDASPKTEDLVKILLAPKTPRAEDFTSAIKEIERLRGEGFDFSKISIE